MGSAKTQTNGHKGSRTFVGYRKALNLVGFQKVVAYGSIAATWTQNGFTDAVGNEERGEYVNRGFVGKHGGVLMMVVGNLS